jgi:hypothetical protein
MLIIELRKKMAIAFAKGFQNNELDNQQMYLKLQTAF